MKERDEILEAMEENMNYYKEKMESYISENHDLRRERDEIRKLEEMGREVPIQYREDGFRRTINTITNNQVVLGEGFDEINNRISILAEGMNHWTELLEVISREIDEEREQNEKNTKEYIEKIIKNEKNTRTWISIVILVVMASSILNIVF